MPVTVNTLFLVGGVLLFLSVLGSTLSTRLGFPLLLIFLVLGMVAGENGLLGIRFDNFKTAFLIGNLALAVILLDGGLRTRISTFRVALWPALTLATWGVLVTVALLGTFLTWLLNVDWRYGLLLAAIVGSTDAAAVFNVMRHSGVRLNERVGATLELESGINDPMAIFLVLLLIGLLRGSEHLDGLELMLHVLQQFGLGAVIGVLGGWALAQLVARLHLPEGLYPLLIASGGLTVFAASNALDSSGFLAIYLAGLVIGNRRAQATEHVLKVLDGLAWLAQAGMFLMLGLLITPANLIDSLGLALLIALFLMLVARPVAVLASLWPFHFPAREIAYISWVGLRGAVPIVLAIFPVMYALPESRLLFEVTFAVVLISLLVQGTSVAPLARLLGIVIPHRAEPRDSKEIWIGDDSSLELASFRVELNSRVAGRTLAVLCELLGNTAQCVMVVRNGVRLASEPALGLEAGDDIWLLADAGELESVATLFSYQDREGQLAARNFFGEFALNPELSAAELANAYNLALTEPERLGSIAELVAGRLGRRAVVGDRVTLGPLRLTIRRIEDGRIIELGMRVLYS